MKYLVLLISLFLLCSSLVYAQEEECIFEKYLNITGDFVVTDCKNKVIIDKQLFDINLTLKNEAIRVIKHPQDKNAAEPVEIENNKYKIEQPLYGYHNYYLFARNKDAIAFLVNVIGYDKWDSEYDNKTLILTPPTPKPIAPAPKPEPEPPDKNGGTKIYCILSIFCSQNQVNFISLGNLKIEFTLLNILIGLGIIFNVWMFYKIKKKRKNECNTRQNLTKSETAEILERQKHKCKKCGVKFYGKHKVRPHYDHIIPLSKGGSNNLKNWQALCPNCHDAKTRNERKKRIR